MSYMAQTYMRRAQEGFVNASRSVVQYAPKSSGYFNNEYSPVAAKYESNQRKEHGNSGLEHKCCNC